VGTSFSSNFAPNYTIYQLAVYYLKLGTFGFGGPVALVERIYNDLVVVNKWYPNEKYNIGLALAQMTPGPLAVQLGMYLGYNHFGVLGALIVCCSFVIPSFLMVLLISILYAYFGNLNWVQNILYGTSAAVLGIVVKSAYMLAIQSIHLQTSINPKAKIFQWGLLVISFILTVVVKNLNFSFFILSGLVYVVLFAPPKFLKNNVNSLFLILVLIPNFRNSILVESSFFFLKAGALVFGSGLAIVPFLHNGVVIENSWLTEEQFVDAVAIAMLTPGPVIIMVVFIGFIIAGIKGAIFAAIGVFLPCFLFTIILSPFFNKIAKNISVKYFIDGIIASIIGSLFGSVVLLMPKSIVDISTLVIFFSTVIILFTIKKIKVPYIILLSSAIGLLVKNLL
jgi:chromate transporter